MIVKKTVPLHELVEVGVIAIPEHNFVHLTNQSALIVLNDGDKAMMAHIDTTDDFIKVIEYATKYFSASESLKMQIAVSSQKAGQRDQVLNKDLLDKILTDFTYELDEAFSNIKIVPHAGNITSIFPRSGDFIYVLQSGFIEDSMQEARAEDAKYVEKFAGKTPNAVAYFI